MHTKMKKTLYHPFSPIFDSNSRVLILGTFPSVKSRENDFYYGHKRNRFWEVIGSITKSFAPNTISEKTELLLKNKIALWDVLKSCKITGSQDSSIEDEIPNDLTEIMLKSNIKAVFANGSTAFKLYMKYNGGYNLPVYCLPSTSPANAKFKLENLTEMWKIILNYTLFG